MEPGATQGILLTMDLKSELQKFGLSDKQAEIYLLLIEQGELRIKELVEVTRIPRSSVYESLKGLQALGLIEKMVEENFALIRPYPLSSIKHNLQDQIQELQSLTTEIETLDKSLQTYKNANQDSSTNIRYYKGRSGARQILWNTFKAKGVLYVYSEWGRGQYVGMEFYRKFVRESQERRVSERVITNSSARVLDSIRTYVGSDISRAKIERIRALSEDQITFKGDTFMYNNIYAQVYLKDKQITGFEIESQQFVDAQRAIFDILWDSATPVSSLL
jgi:sugar-specific transcriptional regulator TrmB